MPTVTPKPRSIAEIKTNLLAPALTSHFEVQVPIPKNIIDNVIKSTGIDLSTVDQNKLNLLCSEVSLPGSSLATLEINNDFTGVTERHAHRRIYDDRIDFTFYVDAEKYLPIIVFESWIKYIVGESVTEDERMRGVGSQAPQYFYRVRYPKTYVSDQGLKVIKFERDYNSRLEYEFIRSYPISITSMPVSYDSSSLLKCTVSMTYIRYILTAIPSSPADPKSVAEKAQAPQEQATKNGNNFGTALSLNQLVNSYGFSGGTGGLPLTAVNSAGNTVQVQEFGGLNKLGSKTATINGGSGIPSNQA